MAPRRRRGNRTASPRFTQRFRIVNRGAAATVYRVGELQVPATGPGRLRVGRGWR